jgi:CheY-like chemotaxis protein
MTLALDGILIAAGILNVVVVRRVLIRRVSRDLIVASLGLIVLSAAHLSETLLGVFLSFIGEGPPELVHRMLVLLAFLCLVYGLSRTGRELWRERARVLQANEELRMAQEELRLSNEELRERNRQLVDNYVRLTAGIQQPIRVLIADPDPDLRRILAVLLDEEKDVRVVGEAADERDAVAAAERLHPDVVLIDASLTGRDCIVALKSMKQPAQVVVAGSYREGAMHALTAGAFDYVLKDAGHNRLLEAIRRAAPAKSEPGAESIEREMGASA